MSGFFCFFVTMSGFYGFFCESVCLFLVKTGWQHWSVFLGPLPEQQKDSHWSLVQGNYNLMVCFIPDGLLRVTLSFMTETLNSCWEPLLMVMLMTDPELFEVSCRKLYRGLEVHYKYINLCVSFGLNTPYKGCRLISHVPNVDKIETWKANNFQKDVISKSPWPWSSEGRG